MLLWPCTDKNIYILLYASRQNVHGREVYILVFAHLTGIFPRSDELIEATRAYEKKKIDGDELKEYFNKDTMKLMEFQTDLDLGCMTDGLLEWHDIFRPFTEKVSGIETGALTRWFNNNTFYRKPIITDKLVSDGNILDGWIHTDLLRATNKQWKVVLPGPYTFALMSENRYYKHRDELILDFAHVLANELKNLEPFGLSCFDLCEPALVCYPPEKDELAAVKSAVDVIATTTSLSSHLQTYFGDLLNIYPEILDFNVDSIGVDFYETQIELMDEYSFTKYLGCGCIDARNSSMERIEDIVSFAQHIFDRVGPDSVTLSPNCDLEYLPRDTAEKKVEVLVDAMKALNSREG